MCSLKDILEKLKREHTHHYVYRGQSSERLPLLTSMYRGLVTQEYTQYKPINRLRGIGKKFYDTEYNIYYTNIVSPRMKVFDYFKHLFGYPLANLIAQQYGVNSQGLDVTTDPYIAGFFATYDFKVGQYVNESTHEGIIYRIRVPEINLYLDKIKNINFFNNPYYLSASELLNAFSECNTWDECYNSFLNYFNYGWVERELELIKIPKELLCQTRIYKQKAGLIFPDVVLSNYYQQFGMQEEKAIKEGLPAIEDISSRESVERFYFKHCKENSEIIGKSSDEVFPDKDIFYDMLAILFNNRHVGPTVFVTGGPYIIKKPYDGSNFIG